MTKRLWFVTGAGRGLGKAFTEAALGAGDSVVATVRTDGALDDLRKQFDALHVKHLDVTDKKAVERVAAEVLSEIGTPDVVVNNAGYGLVGAVEEVSEEEVRAQFDVNLFGAWWVTQAFLPALRERGSGRIIQVSTVGAVGHMPLFGPYNASKWALEGMSSALADELGPLGIGVHLLEFAGYATDWAGSSMQFAAPIEGYEEVRRAIFGTPGYPDANAAEAEPATDEPADEEPEDSPFTDAPPEDAASALLAFLEEDNPSLRKVIGNGGYDMVRMALEDRRDDYERDTNFVWPGSTRT